MLGVCQDSHLSNEGGFLTLLAEYLIKRGIPCQAIPRPSADRNPFLVFSLDKISETDLRESLTGLWNEHVLPNKRALIGDRMTRGISAIVKSSLDSYSQQDPFGNALNNHEEVKAAFTEAISAALLPFLAKKLNQTDIQQALTQAVTNLKLQLN